MADKNFQLGFERKLYRDNAGVWVLMNDVKDVTLSLSTGESDVTTRGNNGWRALAPTLKEAEFTFQLIMNPNSTDFQVIREAFMTAAPLKFAFADGLIATAGTEYLEVTCGVFQFDINESNEEAVMIDVTLKPTYSDDPPAFETVPTP